MRRGGGVSAAAVALGTVASFAVVVPARAQEAAPALRLPVPEAQRPLTLPQLVASPALDFQVDHRAAAGNFVNLDVTARIGLTDDLMLHADVAPLQLWAPGGGLTYGQPYLSRGPGAGAAYRFVRGLVEVAGNLGGRVFTVPGISGGSITALLPVRVHATGSLRLDAVPQVEFVLAHDTATSASANSTRVAVPLQLLANVTRELDLGFGTGLTIYDVGDAADTTGIPLGFFLGYAAPGAQGPLLDVDPFFDFPYLIMPGRRTQTTNAQQYQVGVTLTVYLYL